MKVILYMATTVNGFIAKEDDDTSFTSEEDWQGFNNVSKKCGVVIIGRRTYEVMSPDQFLKECLYVIASKEKLEKKTANVLFVQKTPRYILDLIKEKGYQEVCLAGGAQTNTSFLKENLIDEMYLDLEPVLFGKGVQLFKLDEFEMRLKLLESKKLNDDTIQLHYEVIK